MDWKTIVQRHGPMAFDTAWRLLADAGDAEDVVQEALLDAFRRYGHDRVANWGGLLRHLATCRAIDRLRRRRQTEPLSLEPQAPESATPPSALEERELADALRRAVASLPDREASVFSLRCFGEMTNREIAVTLSITTKAVATALHKARSKLKKMLDFEPQGNVNHRGRPPSTTAAE